MDYSPSREELRAFRQLLRLRTPSASIYNAYREGADEWLAIAEVVPPMMAYAGRSTVALKAKMVPSELFGRDYLVAYVDAHWLGEIAPKCDAIASTMIPSDVGLVRPPLVIVPASRIRARSSSFRSVLEHEFVHINQMLLGVFVEDPTRERPGARLVDDFFAATRVEFEANLLQLTRWPRLYPRSSGLSLAHWCAVRGYSQSLERTLAAVAHAAPREGGVTAFLNELPAELPQFFRSLGVDDDVAAWFRDKWNYHVAVALMQVSKMHPRSGKSAAFREAATWLKAHR